MPRIKKIGSLIVLALFPTLAEAQCAMCRAVLESEANQDAAQGINDGILYLMVFPYLLIGGLLFIIIRTIRKQRQANN